MLGSRLCGYLQSERAGRVKSYLHAPEHGATGFEIAVKQPISGNVAWEGKTSREEPNGQQGCIDGDMSRHSVSFVQSA
ncbi:hypothetical protein SVAN01_10231 [Stagonosporopsis vannaccii]|nr:hypothetical protein SVAN01_10231 [Stagonosporopsis vannaccii]